MVSSTQNDTASRTNAANAAANAAAAAYGAPADGTDTADGTEDRFLKLLVAQMRNQDPLNPLDNAEVTSQLAQINTVRGIEQLNASMTKVATASTAVSPLSAVGLLGRQVLVEGNRFEWTDPDAGIVNNDPTMPNVDLSDSKSVRVGVHTLDWDGIDTDGRAVSSGKYTLRAYGVDENGGESRVVALVPARVNGVSQAPGGARLDLVGRDAVAASAIRAVL